MVERGRLVVSHGGVRGRLLLRGVVFDPAARRAPLLRARVPRRLLPSDLRGAVDPGHRCVAAASRGIRLGRHRIPRGRLQVRRTLFRGQNPSCSRPAVLSPRDDAHPRSASRPAAFLFRLNRSIGAAHPRLDLERTRDQEAEPCLHFNRVSARGLFDGSLSFPSSERCSLPSGTPRRRAARPPTTARRRPLPQRPPRRRRPNLDSSRSPRPEWGDRAKARRSGGAVITLIGRSLDGMSMSTSIALAGGWSSRAASVPS